MILQTHTAKSLLSWSLFIGFSLLLGWSCSPSKSTIGIPTQQKFILGELENSAFSAKLENLSKEDVQVKIEVGLDNEIKVENVEEVDVEENIKVEEDMETSGEPSIDQEDDSNSSEQNQNVDAEMKEDAMGDLVKTEVEDGEDLDDGLLEDDTINGIEPGELPSLEGMKTVSPQIVVEPLSSLEGIKLTLILINL